MDVLCFLCVSRLIRGPMCSMRAIYLYLKCPMNTPKKIHHRTEETKKNHNKTKQILWMLLFVSFGVQRALHHNLCTRSAYVRRIDWSVWPYNCVVELERIRIIDVYYESKFMSWWQRWHRWFFSASAKKWLDEEIPQKRTYTHQHCEVKQNTIECTQRLLVTSKSPVHFVHQIGNKTKMHSFLHTNLQWMF